MGIRPKEWPPIVEKGQDYFLWMVLIQKNGKRFHMPVFRREGIEHKHGKMNNTSPEWWLLHDDQALMRQLWDEDPDNKRGHYRTSIADLNKAEAEGKRYRWVPWGDKYAEVNCWSFTFDTYNEIDHYTKYNSDEWSVKKGGMCRMYHNGMEIYNFPCSDLEYMMTKAKWYKEKFYSDISVRPTEIWDKLVGTKVWYHDQEGEIVNHFLPEDRIVIRSRRPDGKGFNLTKKRHSESNWPESDWNGSMEVHTGLFDNDIYWYRN